ncbi:hypothetical protein LAZ67_14002097 [Cordylochernes scorpioides]|uniref:Uncharacterized protein n=1 Tax=Cordylochernes scorpioides TaxID=51811 RepID=A0ABY6L6N3_9ARAC|nr:hypothetical protein LAZ67_14002097 [Cordylochernes scorpioides]
MREQDRDAQAKTSQIPPGASSTSPNSDTDNQKVIKLQNTSTSLSKSPEESMKNKIEGVEKEDSVKTARATDVKPTLAKARMLKEACPAPSIIDIEYEGKKGAVSAIKEKELNAAVKCNKVKDSETAVDSYVGVREAEAKDKANEAEAKPDKVNSKDGDKGDQVKESEANPKDEGKKDSEGEPKGDGVRDSEYEPKGDGVKDSKDEPKGDGVRDFEDEPKGDGVNDAEARPTGDTESKIKNKGDLQKLKGNPGDWLSRWGQFGRNNANEKYEEANLNDKEDSEAKPKGDGVKDSETAIKGYESVNNSKAVAEGTESKVEEKLDAEQGTDSKVEEKLDVEQGTESRVEENLDAEQGTESRMEEGIIDPKDWFRSESRATPIRPVCDGASWRGRSGLSLKRRPILLRRIPEIGIKLRKNKYGVLADMGRYFQVMAIKEMIGTTSDFFGGRIWTLKGQPPVVCMERVPQYAGFFLFTKKKGGAIQAQNRELRESLGVEFKCLESEISPVKEDVSALKQRLAAVETGHSKTRVFQEENNNSSRPVAKVPTFDRQSSWTSFKTQFNYVAQANGGNVRDKASFLAAALRGPVLEVFQMIPENLCLDFDSLVNAL